MTHVNHLKGQNVNLLLDLDQTGSFAVVASSTNCDFSVSANTEDTSAKDDPGNGTWAAPAQTYYDWSSSNESYLVSATFLQTLLNKVVNGDATVDVQFQTPGNYATACCWKGTAIISQLEVQATIGENVKVNISLTGASALSSGTFVTLSPLAAIATKIRGKALMVATKVDTNWDTTLCSTSHTLSISVETEDTMDKDMNDKATHKAVASKSVTISTEALVPSEDNSSLANTHNSFLMGKIMAGTSVHLAFGYYPDSIGQSVEDTEAEDYSWGTPGTVLLEGDFLVTSLTPASGENKADSKMSAEFQSVGAPTVVAPV